MSRQSRKQQKLGENRRSGKIAVSLLVLGMFGFGISYTLLRSYLHSDAFRKFLSIETSKIAGITGEFSRFHWQGLAIDTAAFEAQSSGIITGIRADDLHAEVGLGSLRRGVWEIRNSSLRRLELNIDARKPQSLNSLADPKLALPQSDLVPSNLPKLDSPKLIPSKLPLTPPATWFPRKAELQGVDVREVVVKATLDQGLAVASGIRIHAEQAASNDAYRAELTGGTLQLPFPYLPKLRLDRALLRYQNQQVFLTDGTLAVCSNGKIQGSGEWDMKSQRFNLQGDATSIKCEDLLNPDWQKRLTGDVTADFSLDNNAGFPTANGKLSLQNATLTSLPMLDVLAAYADTRRFRMLTLSEAHTEWYWKKGEITLTKLVLASEGLVRLEGNITLRGQVLDGMFRLGLVPGTLASIPGAESDVFVAGERGLLWTTLHLTGTLDAPKEDLSGRLITAAGMRMLEQLPVSGEQVLKFTRSLFDEPSDKSLEKNAKILGESTKAVRQVSNILQGIFGGTKQPEPAPELKSQ